MWHVTCDTCHVTHDTWHVTRDMWHVTCDMWHVTLRGPHGPSQGVWRRGPMRAWNLVMWPVEKTSQWADSVKILQLARTFYTPKVFKGNACCEASLKKAVSLETLNKQITSASSYKYCLFQLAMVKNKVQHHFVWLFKFCVKYYPDCFWRENVS